MGAITIIREIKQIHPNYVTLIRMGGFYRVYGKDAYILSNLFEYKIKQEEDIVSCGFPTKAISKVQLHNPDVLLFTYIYICYN